jgi:hypothetical protein
MPDSFVSIASSQERATLERLEKYLVRHGLSCRVAQASGASERFALSVAEGDLEKAQRLLADVSLIGGDMHPAEEVVEIRCNETERTEIAAWLQVLLDEQDEEGSPVYFYRPHYEAMLDALLAEGRAEAPLFLLRGLRPFLPESHRRLLMGKALQEFFQLIDAVSSSDEG